MTFDRAVNHGFWNKMSQLCKQEGSSRGLTSGSRLHESRSGRTPRCYAIIYTQAPTVDTVSHNQPQPSLGRNRVGYHLQRGTMDPWSRNRRGALNIESTWWRRYGSIKQSSTSMCLRLHLSVSAPLSLSLSHTHTHTLTPISNLSRNKERCIFL